MTTQELNIANALHMAKSLIAKMIEARLIEAKYLYGVAKAVSIKFDLDMDSSIMIVENATQWHFEINGSK